MNGIIAHRMWMMLSGAQKMNIHAGVSCWVDFDWALATAAVTSLFKRTQRGRRIVLDCYSGPELTRAAQ
jgi:hypothetical protein